MTTVLQEWNDASPLRGWQREALAGWLSRCPQDELVIATPAAGKSRLAIRLAHALLRKQQVRKVLVVVPKLHLKRQLSRMFSRAGMKIEWRWDGGRLPSDSHGAAITYQQVAADPESIARITHDSLGVFDEIHHASTEAVWGKALQYAFDYSPHRLAMSGTIERTDRAAVPFVTYDEYGIPVAGYEYSYMQALADGVCRPLTFSIVDGTASFIDSDGEKQSTDASGAWSLGRRRASEWLRTQQNLGFAGVLEEAHEALLECRRTIDRNAGGLVVARDQDHARHLALLLHGITGEQPALVVSDEENADKQLEAYARGRAMWIVAVHMVSEGIDIPRLRFGVFCSSFTTAMYFRQYEGRFIRVTEAPGAACLYVPAHPLLVEHIQAREQEVRIGLAARRGSRRAVREAVAKSTNSQYLGLAGGLEIHNSHVVGSDLPAEHTEDEEWDVTESLRDRVNLLANQLARLSGKQQQQIHAGLNKRFHDTVPTASVWSLESRVKQLEVLLQHYQ